MLYVAESVDSGADVSQDQMKLKTIYEQYEDKMKNIEQMELHALELAQKVQSLQEENAGNEMEVQRLQQLVSSLETTICKSDDPLKAQTLKSAVEKFEATLQQVSAMDWDRQLVLQLLQANSDVLQMHMQGVLSSNLTEIQGLHYRNVLQEFVRTEVKITLNGMQNYCSVHILHYFYYFYIIYKVSSFIIILLLI